MKITHIYWFSYFNLAEPSVRYRAKYPLLYLKEKYDVPFSIVYPGYDAKNIQNFIRTFLSVLFFRKKNSLIVFQKINTVGIYTTALKILLFFRSRNTLYDIDDAEYTRRSPETMHYFMRNCSACSGGSESLVNYMKQFNSNVFFLTSPVIDHKITKNKLEKILTIGWIGYYGAHRNSLHTLFFPALLNINFPVKLKLLGVKNNTEIAEINHYFEGNPNIIVETPLNLEWLNENSIYEIIKTFDIGVAPLIDNEFNRGKSAFKAKQCLSCGIPVLASSVGENKRFIQDGVNGYLCETPMDYLEKIMLFKDMQQEGYKKLCKNAKESFTSFSIEHYVLRFLAFYKNIKN